MIFSPNGLKTPSQLKRDRKRKEDFIAKKLEVLPAEEGTIDKVEKVLLVNPRDEISPEVEELCDELFVIPKKEVDNHNIGIEYDVKGKVEAKEIKVKKVLVERLGDSV